MIPPTIPENHKMTIRSVATQQHLMENELVRLYLACDELRTQGTCSATNVAPSRLESPLPDGPGHRILLVTVTNAKGVYVQQAQVLRKAAENVMLTVGQKYSMEGRDESTSQISTKMFTTT